MTNEQTYEISAAMRVLQSSYRIRFRPADTWHEFDDGTEEYRDGYACAECMTSECYRCDEPIPLDEDYSTDEGNTRLHWGCLTGEETKIIEEVD